MTDTTLSLRGWGRAMVVSVAEVVSVTLAGGSSIEMTYGLLSSVPGEAAAPGVRSGGALPPGSVAALAASSGRALFACPDSACPVSACPVSSRSVSSRSVVSCPVVFCSVSAWSPVGSPVTAGAIPDAVASMASSASAVMDSMASMASAVLASRASMASTVSRASAVLASRPSMVLASRASMASMASTVLVSTVLVSPVLGSPVLVALDFVSPVLRSSVLASSGSARAALLALIRSARLNLVITSMSGRRSPGRVGASGPLTMAAAAFVPAVPSSAPVLAPFPPPAPVSGPVPFPALGSPRAPAFASSLVSVPAALVSVSA